MSAFSSRSFCLSIALLLPIGCTTGGAETTSALPEHSGSERREMTGLEDMSFEYIKSQWGEPDASETKTEGRVLRYKNIRSEDVDAMKGTVQVKSCLVRLDLNKNDLVTAWEYESCRLDK